MDLRKIKTLIDLVEQSGISELEVKEGEESVRISRQTAPYPPTYLAPPMHAPAAIAPPAPAAAAPAPAAAPAAPPKDTRHLVRAPMVGTFYRSPSPGAKSF